MGSPSHPLALDIAADIRDAHTPEGSFYSDPAWFKTQCDRVFTRTWHMWPHNMQPSGMGEYQPWNLLPRALDEPLLLTHDGEQLRCISNVCTHRGKVLFERAGQASSLRCGYHGRRFDLDGSLIRAPGFELARDFSCAAQNLARVPLAGWRNLLFASLDPAHALEDLLAPLRARLDGLLPAQMSFCPQGSRTYDVGAHWALYCDNYLEGFHIPYVHPGLNAELNYEAYSTELFELGSLQVGVAKRGASTFKLRKSHPDSGRMVSAYYFWLFPCTMLNVYPWGLSINVVLPQGVSHTKVVYLRYLWDEAAEPSGAGGDLDQVEIEDEDVVESCARGVRARLYKRGRYAPDHERAVHHFHRLVGEFLR